MSFIFNSRKRSGSEVAVVMHDAVLDLWREQSEAVKLIKRGLLAKCIPEEESQTWTKDMNRLRRDLQDEFLLETNPARVQDKIQRATEELKRAATQIVTIVNERERSMPAEERARNIVEGFDAQLAQAKENGLINRITAQELQAQSQMYFTALRKNMDDPNIRPNIKTNLVHELIDDYYSNVSNIFSRAASGH